ncbi:hypothetical protein Dsin_022749 [Dipteronia sinensis]|uniref:DUF4283 domain-containing protein n=1 Tax=Dipteronia sinensis TaxID=43782 RepID=A0AAE0A329_9ROSI|nr:hypothetical protein Dsin_022749 [Dipteronia sinensis]
MRENSRESFRNGTGHHVGSSWRAEKESRDAGGATERRRTECREGKKGDVAHKVSGAQAGSQTRRSFVEVVEGGTGHDGKVQEKVETIHWKGKYEDSEWLSKCAVGVLNQFSSISSVNERLDVRDFRFSSIYLGGRRILWCFETKSECEGFIRNSFFWKDCFLSMERWSDSFINNVRVAWVNCWGVPLSSWCSAFFTRMGRSFGDPIHIEDDTILRRRMDRGRILMLLPIDQVGPSKIQVVINRVIYEVKLEEDPIPISVSWIDNFLDLRNLKPHSNLNTLRSRKEEGEASSVRVTHKSDVLEIKEATGQVDGDEFSTMRRVEQQSSHNKGDIYAVRIPTSANHTLSESPHAGRRLADKGKGTWIKKFRVKARTICDKTAKINLDKRREEVGRTETVKSFYSTSSEDDSLERQISELQLCKGECSRRRLYSGPQSPSLDQVLVAHSSFHSEGLATRGRKEYSVTMCGFDGEGPWPITNVSQPHSTSSHNGRSEKGFGNEKGGGTSLFQEEVGGQMLIKDKNSGGEEVFSETDPGSGGMIQNRSKDDGLAKGLLLVLGEKESDGMGEINLSVVLSTPSPKKTSPKYKGLLAKMHGMQTRRDKSRDTVVSTNNEKWNLEVEITKVVEKGVELGVDFNSKSKTVWKTGKWNLEDEIFKVLETGKALGFDFHGIEDDMVEQLSRRETEDDERFKKAHR